MNFIIVWSKRAKIDVALLINRAPLYYRKNKIILFDDLRNFLQILTTMPYLGKVISNNDFEIRQIIFRKYRILYSIINHQIRILRIIHGQINFNNESPFQKP